LVVDRFLEERGDIGQPLEALEITLRPQEIYWTIVSPILFKPPRPTNTIAQWTRAGAHGTFVRAAAIAG
jgi:hypothetical protein